MQPLRRPDWKACWGRVGGDQWQQAAEAGKRDTPALQIARMLENDADLHLQRLQQVAVDIVVDAFLRFGTGERDIALLE